MTHALSEVTDNFICNCSTESKMGPRSVTLLITPPLPSLLGSLQILVSLSLSLTENQPLASF